MAKKNQEETKVASAEETDANIQTTEETQKEAEKVASGDTSTKKYKLADPSTSYSEHDFKLVGDQEKQLPEDPSDQLIERIRSGFIVEAGK